MNNNMPNNFNNGMPNNNPKPVNNFVGGPEQAAKEQLVGGQSAVGNGPSVMQGMPNVQTDRGVMQGASNVPNTPGVMQGSPMPNRPNVAPVMPGQGNSGINAFTMQKEEPVKNDSPEVVSIPNFASNIPDAPKPNPVVPPVQNPNGIGNPMPNINQPVNNGIPSSNGAMPNQVNAPSLGNSVSPMNMPEINKDPLPKKEVPSVQSQMTLNNDRVNEPSVNQAPNTSGQVNNQGLNSFPLNNMNQMGKQNDVNGQMPNINQPVNSQPINNQPMGNQPVNNRVMSNPAVNNGNTAMVDGVNTNPSTGIKQASPVATSSLNNDVVEMPDMPEKKFPLSTREMILVGLALVAIIVFVIRFWP